METPHNLTVICAPFCEVELCSTAISGPWVKGKVMESIKMLKWLWRHGKPMWIMAMVTFVLQWQCLYYLYEGIGVELLKWPTQPNRTFFLAALALNIGLTLARPDPVSAEEFHKTLMTGNREAMWEISSKYARELLIESAISLAVTFILLVVAFALAGPLPG